MEAKEFYVENMEEVVVYLDKDYSRNDSFMVLKGTSKIDLLKMVNERYGKN